MKLATFFRRAPEPAPIASLRAADAYACLDCERISEGATNLRCQCCGSAAIYHLMTLLNATKNRAVQRLKMAEAMKAARQRGERNDLAFLTTPEPPHDAA